MKIKPQTAIVVTLLILVIGIMSTSILGLYNVKTTKTPAKFETAGYTDQYDPGDIRGSYTFSDITTLFDIPIADLAEAFGLSLDTASSTKVSGLEKLYDDSTYEIGTASMRLFVAYYLGLPYESGGDAHLPESAANSLIDHGLLSQEQRSYVDSHTVYDPN